MSDDLGMKNKNNKENTDGLVQEFRCICGSAVSKQRILELLEATNGSLERAINLFFHQQNEYQQPITSNGLSDEDYSFPTKHQQHQKQQETKKKAASPRSKVTGKGLTQGINKKRKFFAKPKQARLDSFFKNNQGIKTSTTINVGEKSNPNNNESIIEPNDGTPSVPIQVEDDTHNTFLNEEENDSQNIVRISSSSVSNSNISVFAIREEETFEPGKASAAAVASDDVEEIMMKDEISNALSRKEIRNKNVIDVSSKAKLPAFGTHLEPDTSAQCPIHDSAFTQDSSSHENDKTKSNFSNEKQEKVYKSTGSTLVEASSFLRLSEALQEMADTTKRLVKLDALHKYIRDIITARDSNKSIKDRDRDDSSKRPIVRDCYEERSYILTCALQLVLGQRRWETAIGNDEAPASSSAPLDVSGSAVTKSLQSILGVSRMQLSKAYRKYGDLGDSAASFFQKKARSFFVSKNPTKSQKPLSIIQVYESLQKIAISTDGRDAKQHLVVNLMRSCQSKSELRFIVRMLLGNMRIGASLKTVLASLAITFHSMTVINATETTVAVDDEDEDMGTTVDQKDAISLIQKTHDVCPNMYKIIKSLLEGGFEGMKKDCGIQLLTPIAPMLANPIHSLDQVEKAMADKNNSMVMEWKYDGVRCQVHYSREQQQEQPTLKLFSRHLLETTLQYPDAAQSILQAVRNDNVNHSSSVESFILDSEIVGVEVENGNTRLLPFQDLSKRKRKNDYDNPSGVNVKVFAFDLMYLNGSSLVNHPLWERQKLLRENFIETNGFGFVSSARLPVYNESSIRGFLEDAIRGGAEGLMLKMLGKSREYIPLPPADDDEKLNSGASKKMSFEEPLSTMDQMTARTAASPYEAGTRSQSWLKVKRDYVAGYADTIDVVPIGAWYGHGRKAKKNFLSPVLLAVYDEDEDVFRSISRCMSFTDSMYEAMREFYFRGTPYPQHVGSDRGSGDNTNVKLPLPIQEEEENNTNDLACSDASKSDDDDNGLEGGIGDTDKLLVSEESEITNCYTDRPSSAVVITNESPPIWFKPLEVFEVSFADMTLSRQHTAAAGLVDDPECRGVALRFPRFKRRRPDKKVEDATTTVQIAQLFTQQSKQKATQRPGGYASR